MEPPPSAPPGQLASFLGWASHGPGVKMAAMSIEDKPSGTTNPPANLEKLFSSRRKLTVRFDGRQLRDLARLIVVEMKRAKIAQVPDRLPEALTPKQAIDYTGRGRTAVFGFMRRMPLACTIDGDGIRRVRRRWLDAWCEGEHAVAAVRRGSPVSRS